VRYEVKQEVTNKADIDVSVKKTEGAGKGGGFGKLPVNPNTVLKAHYELV